jgi:hypothetical protein
LPLIVGLTFATMIVVRIADEPREAWRWCLAIVAAVALGLIVALLTNFAVFGPIYWLLGKRHPKETRMRKPTIQMQ